MQTNDFAGRPGLSIPSEKHEPAVIVVMGVSGSGKSTIGTLLAQALNCRFIEGDDLHPSSNVEKMRSGVALEDDDRWPWLQALGERSGEAARHDGLVIVACSSLKRIYRKKITHAAGCDTYFLFLDADQAQLRERVAARTDHYMPASLIDSQIATLEPPQSDEQALRLATGEDAQLLLPPIKAWLALKVGLNFPARSEDKR